MSQQVDGQIQFKVFIFRHVTYVQNSITVYVSVVVSRTSKITDMIAFWVIGFSSQLCTICQMLPI